MSFVQTVGVEDTLKIYYFLIILLSIETIQDRMSNDIFAHTKSPRKASGRAMGTIVEIITYYLLLSWGARKSLSIEISLPEYDRNEITHNVEFSLHPQFKTYELKIDGQSNSITGRKICEEMMTKHNIDIKNHKNTLFTKHGVLRNACLIHKELVNQECRFIANMIDYGNVEVTQQSISPYMIFECKRVGQDAKNNKGPQAIEKAKQGSYVAKTVSSLQKIRDGEGNSIGILYEGEKTPTIKPYDELINELIQTDNIKRLKKFIVTVGIISNHGNWFTAENQNKEMQVLSSSYDWLLFLTDEGLTKFINEVILNSESYPSINKAFKQSYSKDNTTGTKFTKVNMDYKAHRELIKYFTDNNMAVESWFNIIQPNHGTIDQLREQMQLLCDKNWEDKI